MPCKPRWFLHIPDIVMTLETLPAPVVDRALVEELFGVRRRQAVTLMQHFGGYRSGNTILIDRTAMIEQLEALQSSPDVQAEVFRKQRLSERLARLHRHCAAAQVKIPVPPDVHERCMSDLPDGITLCPTRLTVDFNDAEQLLAKLYEFSQAVANDYAQFCRALEAPG